MATLDNIADAIENRNWDSVQNMISKEQDISSQKDLKIDILETDCDKTVQPPEAIMSMLRDVINARHRTGWSVLEEVAAFKSSKGVLMLVANGADASILNRWSNTALS